MSQPIKLSILWKGLLVLLLPFILQAFFFYNLHQLSMRSEALAKAEIQQSDLLHFMDGLLGDLLELHRVATAERFSAKPTDVLSSEALRDAFFKKVEDNRRLWEGNRQTENAVEMAKTACVIETGNLSDRESVRGSLLSMTYIYGWMRQSLRKLTPEMTAVKQAAEIERVELRRRRDAAELNRKELDSQLGNLAIADGILAIGILLWFLRDMTKRLRLLVRNAQTIPNGPQSMAAVGGGDELAYLDGVIHSVSDELKTAAEHRKFLIEMVSHDLRSPLLSAKLTIDRLVRKWSDDRSPETEALEGASNGIGRVTSLVEDLLTIEKLEAGKLELDIDQVDPHALVDDVFATLGALAKSKNIQMENVVRPTPIEADPARLSQVLENLVSNAIKFSPADGTVAVSNEIGAQSVKFQVIDQGPGIPPDQQRQLFEKYTQTKDGQLQGGFGLGLAISKLIVVAHGGEVGVESQPTAGTNIWFTLPISVDLTQD